MLKKSVVVSQYGHGGRCGLKIFSGFQQAAWGMEIPCCSLVRHTSLGVKGRFNMQHLYTGIATLCHIATAIVDKQPVNFCWIQAGRTHLPVPPLNRLGSAELMHLMAAQYFVS